MSKGLHEADALSAVVMLYLLGFGFHCVHLTFSLLLLSFFQVRLVSLGSGALRVITGLRVTLDQVV